MKRREILASILAATVAPATFSALGGLLFASAPARAAMGLAKKYPVINNPGVPFGAYDPHGDFKDISGVAIEHLFLPWQDVDLSTLTVADAYARARGRSLLITIEPWSWAENKRVSAEALRRGILAGQYDATIEQVTKAIGALQSDVTIRWAHEMEDLTGRFPWSGWNPKDYIAAYHRFVDLSRRFAPRAKYMWSPEGLDNLTAYYPGDKYVDIVGLSVFGLQQFDVDKTGRNRTFAELLKPPYDLVVRYDKPIVVAEAGYVGDETYVADWAASLNKLDANFPKLTAVVLFDDKEVHPWPDPYGLPDWRVVANNIL
jgi:beta-mannanase